MSLASKREYEKKKIVKQSKYCVSVRCRSLSKLYNYIVTEGGEDIKISKAYASRGGVTYLGIADTRPVEKCEQIQERQPRNRTRVHLAHQLAFIDARYIYPRVVDRVARRLFRTVPKFVGRDVFLVREAVVRHGLRVLGFLPWVCRGMWSRGKSARPS